MSLQHLSTKCHTATPSGTSSSSSSSPTARQQLALTAAKYVHRASRGCRAIGRSVVPHLDLTEYPVSSLEAPGDSSDDTVTLPWDFLGDAASLCSLGVATSQIPALLVTPGSCFSALAARLTRLEVTADEYDSEEEGQQPLGAWQLPDLLAACTGLQQLKLWGHEVDVCLPAGKADTLPALPITQLELGGSAFNWAAPWVVRQLVPTLRGLRIWSTVGLQDDPVNNPKVDLSSLGALTGLRELTVEEVLPPGANPPACEWDDGAAWPVWVPEGALLGLPHLTKLVLRDGKHERTGGRWPSPEVWQLTQLRHLELAGYADLTTLQFRERRAVCSALTGLTHFDLSSAYVMEVPTDMDTAMPHLAVLRLPLKEQQRRAPPGLTRLTELSWGRCRYMGWTAEWTALQRLHLAFEGTAKQVGPHLRPLVALQELQIEHSTDHPRRTDTDWTALDLTGLTSLSKLVLVGAPTLGAGAAAAMAGGSGGGSGTSSVGVGGSAGASSSASGAPAAAAIGGQMPAPGAATTGGPAAAAAGQAPATAEAPGAEGAKAAASEASGGQCAPLFGLGALPHLLELGLPHQVFDSPQHMSAWLAQQTALTRLEFKPSGHVPSAAALERLPVQLQVLRLPGGLEEVPASLSRLQQLTELRMGRQPAVTQLPGWLSALQRLEGLDIEGTQVATAQPVLGQLPLLRVLGLPGGVDDEEVCEHAPYLCQ